MAIAESWPQATETQAIDTAKIELQKESSFISKFSDRPNEASDLLSDLPIVFKEDTVGLEPTAPNIRAGSGISIAGKAFSYALPISWQKNNDGVTRFGYLSAGHMGVAAGQTVTYNGTTIGVVRFATQTPDKDFSLIEITGSAYLPSNTMLDGTRVTRAATPVQYDEVVMYGAMTGGSVDGYIESPTANVKTTSVTGQAIYNYNFIQYNTNKLAIAGDSGGAIVADRNGVKYLVGVQTQKSPSSVVCNFGPGWNYIKQNISGFTNINGALY